MHKGLLSKSGNQISTTENSNEIKCVTASDSFEYFGFVLISNILRKAIHTQLLHA